MGTGAARDDGDGDGDDGDAVVLHSSVRGLVSGYGGSLLVIAVGSYGVAAGEYLPLGVPLLVAGAALLAVMLFDFPLWCRFDDDGVERRALLSRRRLAYDRIDRIIRARSGSAVRALRGGSHQAPTGGLVARVGRRRYMLVDRAGELDEDKRLRALLAVRAPGVFDE